ncbi:MAG: PIN domain-containing protein [Geminicoccaceae bacterium]
MDANVLVYGFLEPDSDKGRVANETIARVSAVGVVAVQAIGEFLWVVRRRRPEWLDRATQRSQRLRRVLTPIATDLELMIAASGLVQRHGLQFWDALILKASARGGASLLLSEDMQDGAELDGIRLLNPFEPANRDRLEVLLRV